MQDRYAGDVGDFGKFILLKELNRQGLSIGVNWYRTEPLAFEKKPNGVFKHNDGGRPIPDRLKCCDEPLAETLTAIANSENRSINTLEEAKIISDAVYYNHKISVDKRTEWHEKALILFKERKTELVFLDPDNGLLVPSVKKQQMQSVKYAFYEEARNYLTGGCSVLIYNHRSRKPELTYFSEIEANLRSMLETTEIPFAPEIFEITFPSGSIRDYFAIPATQAHAAKIQAAFSNLLTGKCAETKLCRQPLTSGITYTE